MDLFWINDSMAVTSRPRGGDWLDDEMADLVRQGVGVVVSCLTSSEEAELELADEAQAASRQGLDFVRAAMPDRGTPASRTRVTEVVGLIERHTSGGGRVAIHCRQGLGRAPLVAAAVLVRSGMTPDAAWRLIADRRNRSVPDTDEQREWIAKFAHGPDLPIG